MEQIINQIIYLGRTFLNLILYLDKLVSIYLTMPQTAFEKRKITKTIKR